MGCDGAPPFCRYAPIALGTLARKGLRLNRELRGGAFRLAAVGWWVPGVDGVAF